MKLEIGKLYKLVGDLSGEYGSCIYSKECDNTQCGHIDEHKLGCACERSPCAFSKACDVKPVEAVCLPTATFYSCGVEQLLPKRARMLRPEVCQV